MLRINNADIHYEQAGSGATIVMIHAGIADSRQWNNEFQRFADRYEVIRYDMRGFGQSEPADGEFNHLDDLTVLLETLKVEGPIVLIGCSMGGGLALDYTLQNAARVAALILVDSAPSGLHIDVETPEKFKLVEAAENAGDLELVAELETQIWFDGDRPPDEVNQTMRKLVFDMNRVALSHAAKQLGKRLPNTESPAVERLKEIQVPVLAILGAHDIPYMHAAIDYLDNELANIQTETIENAAHLPNLDQPDEFEKIVRVFLESLPG